MEFSRKYKLASKKDFQFVFDKPFRVTQKHLLALFRPNSLDHPRLGIIISKRYIKLAVDRNRVRRIIRESFRHHKEVLKGLDIIILMRSECSPQDKKSLRDDIQNLWRSLANAYKRA